MDTRESAAALSSLGLAVFPLKPRSKHPATPHGVKDATTDMARIDKWGEQGLWHGVGVACGEPSGVIVVDIDTRHGGDAALEELESRHGKLPATWECLTGGGGRHLYYRGVCRTHKLAPGGAVDLRGTGSYVVAPPSIHPETGKRYEWELSSVPGEAALADAPAWVLAHTDAPVTANAVPSGEARPHMLSRHTLAFLQFGAREGERNNRLYAAACDMAGCGFTMDEALPGLAAAAAISGLPPSEAQRTIRSAWSKPRAPAAPPLVIPDHLNVGGSRGARGAGTTIGVNQASNEAGSRAASGERAADGNRHTITNVTDAFRQTPDGPIPIKLYKPIVQIGEEVVSVSGGWPKSVSGMLFVYTHDGDGIPSPSAFRALARPEELFAWMQEVADLRWTGQTAQCPETKAARTPASKSEMLAHMRACVPDRYVAYSMMPHHPPIDGVYYPDFRLPAPTGEALREFIARLNPETDEDRDLMEVALITPGWGGATGTRPAFVFTSDHGRGSGKSATMQAMAKVWGGGFKVQAKEPWEQVVKRLLSDSGLGRRIVEMDNLKGRGGGQDIEALITSDWINGWRPYHGDYSRPNYMTVFISANTPRLSQDLSERSVVIKVGKQRHEQGFVAWASKFIEDNRPQLIADIMARLRGEKASGISTENRDRWQDWQDSVLCLFENGDRLAALIKGRRSGVDADDDDAADVAEAIHAALRERGYNPDSCYAKITRDEMRELLIKHKVVTEGFNKNAVHTYVANLLGTSGPLFGLTDSKSRKGGRAWIWNTTGQSDPESGSDIPV